ncbi:MAG: nitroreductase family protein [Bacteroidales bacterium]|nr:nitroreductase family protein [Bacteroidales bacterium]
MKLDRDTLLKAIRERHSVRAYEDRPLDDDLIRHIQDEVDNCNRQGGLHLQLITDEPNAFNSAIAHYGHFSNVSNYVALIGKKSEDLDERLGYYGESIVLLAQALGLRTCWVGLSFSKRKGRFDIKEGEKLRGVISLGYGKYNGRQHKSKPVHEFTDCVEPFPTWFADGLDAAMLAPTAVNQQKFRFIMQPDGVTAKASWGFYTKMDLGIVKLHFEIGAGKENFKWV